MSIPDVRQLEREMTDRLAALIPGSWTTMPNPVVKTDGPRSVDAALAVRAPDGAEVTLVLEVKGRLAPRDVAEVIRRLRLAVLGLDSPVQLIVAAPYLSELTQRALVTEGVGYIDGTGNALITCDRPALYIRTIGASRDPSPSDDALRTLRGPGAAQAVRALLDFKPPYGIRELAARADVALGTLSRTVDLLDRDALVERSSRGAVERVDVGAVVRRWAKDYSISGSNKVIPVLAARGLPALATRLASVSSTYAATGAIAAAKFAPVAPTRLAALYAKDPERSAKEIDLRFVDAGANVWLIQPWSDVVFARASRRGDLVCASPSQIAVDLLTGPGRDPSEGEELLAWMERNPDEWRT